LGERNSILNKGYRQMVSNDLYVVHFEVNYNSVQIFGEKSKSSDLTNITSYFYGDQIEQLYDDNLFLSGTKS